MLARPTHLTIGVAAVCVVACGGPTGAPPFQPVASVDQLMLGPIAHAATTYWNAVSTVVDKDGIHEKAPSDDREWTAVWNAGLTLAESGNLLMMPTRARDDEWNRLALDLVRAGRDAAKAAEARSTEGVLEQGEKVYDACQACHRAYVMDLDSTEVPSLRLPAERPSP